MNYDNEHFKRALEFLMRRAFLTKWEIREEEIFRETLEAAYSDAITIWVTFQSLLVSRDARGDLEPKRISRDDLKEVRDAAQCILVHLENFALREWLRDAEAQGHIAHQRPQLAPWHREGDLVPTIQKLLWQTRVALEADGRQVEARLRSSRLTAHIEAAAEPLWHFFMLELGRSGAINKQSGNQGSGYSPAVRFVTECLEHLFPDDKRVTEATIHSLLKPKWVAYRK